MKDLNTNYQIFCLTTTPYLQNELLHGPNECIHRKQLENFFRTEKKEARIWFPIHFYCPIPSHLKVEYEKLVKQIFLAFQSPLYLSLSYFLFSNRNRVVRLSPRASVSVNTDSIKMVFPVQLWRMRKCSISSSTPTNDGFFLSDSIVLLLPFEPPLLLILPHLLRNIPSWLHCV